MKINWVGWILLGLTLSVLYIVLAALGVSSAWNLAIVSVAGVIFVWQGLVELPPSPPHKGVRTWFRKRTNTLLDEGWNFLFLYPFVQGVIPINVQAYNQDILIENVRTPDLAEVRVPIGLTWSPNGDATLVDSAEQNNEKTLPLNNFIFMGSHRGVADIFRDIVAERVREWLIAAHEGPRTWKQAQQAKMETILVLLKILLGEIFEEQVPSSVPTTILYRYFTERYPNPEEEEIIAEWGERFERVERDLVENSANLTWNKESLPYDDYLSLVREKVSERVVAAEKLQRGNGAYRVHKLGIHIHRLNVGEIAVVGETAKAAERRARERMEREGEKVELEHLRDRIRELTASPDDPDVRGGGLSREQALEAFQTERGKVVKTVSESKLSISPETQGLLERIASAILSALSSKGKGRSE